MGSRSAPKGAVVIPAERLLPASTVPGAGGFQPVKVRAAVADLLPARSLYHQDTQAVVKDFLKYDEVSAQGRGNNFQSAQLTLSVPHMASPFQFNATPAVTTVVRA
jgi:hypothetical protein